jgi:hypothetical protein
MSRVRPRPKLLKRLSVFVGAIFLVCSLVVRAADVDLLDDFWEKSDVDRGLPGNVLRMDVDVTGDGLADILLANSQKSGTAGVQQWYVYKKIADGRYRSLGPIELSYGLFLVNTSSGGPKLVAYYRDSGPVGSVVTFAVTDTGFNEESVEENVTAVERASQFATWRTQVGLKVLAAPVTQFTGVIPPSWKNLLNNQPVSDATSLEGLVVEQ